MQDLAECRGVKSQTLAVKKLLLLDAVRQRQVLRAWFSERGFAMPSSGRSCIKSNVIFCNPVRIKIALSCVWMQVEELRRYRDELYIIDCLAHHDATQVFSWDLTPAAG